MNVIIARLLRDMAELIDRINASGEYRRARLSLYLSFFSLALTFMISVTDWYPVWGVGAAYTVSVALACRRSIKFIAKTAIYLAVLSTIVGLPLLITGRSQLNSLSEITITSAGPRESLGTFTSFVVRVTLASLPSAATLYYVGWPTLASRFYRVRVLRTATALVTLFIILLPRTLRRILLLLQAREARTFDTSLWRSLSSALGELIIVSASHSRELQKAIEARTFHTYPYEVGGPYGNTNIGSEGGKLYLPWRERACG